MERFFGGNPGAVILRLMIISLIVGVLLSVLGLDPRDIVDSFIRLLERIYNMGFDAIEWAVRYFLLGAVIVFPIWLISRITKLMGRGGRSSDPLEGKSRRSDL